MLLHYVNEFFFWILAYLLVWQAYVLVFNKGVPNIGTAPAIRKTIIGMLKKDSEARKKNSYTIIDLGSGNGAFARQIARNLPHARVIGLEISRQAVRWSTLHNRRPKLDNLEYKEADFFSYDLSKADAVVMYQVIYLMENIGKKLNKELKKGTLVTSNKFRLGDGWVPEETLRVNTLYLHQRYLHVYRKS